MARARTADGLDAVLKVGLPEGDVELPLAREAAVLHAADGVGYARRLAWVPEHRALLLERLGLPLERRGLDPWSAITTMADTLVAAWTVGVDAVAPPAPGEEKPAALGRLIVDLDASLGHPLPTGVRSLALAALERRAAAHDDVGTVVAHGDPHPSNLLRAPRGREGAPAGYAWVDPDGFHADPAYDLGVLLRDWSSHLDDDGGPALLGRWTADLASRTGVDAEAIADWALAERVSTGLYLASFGADALAAPFLRTAARLA